MRPLAALAFLAVLCVARPGAGESALDHVVPRLDRERFGPLLAELGLEGEQRLIAELAFADYRAAVNELVEAIDAAAAASGQRRLEDALTGRTRLAPAELRSIQIEVLRAYREAWPACDLMLASLLESMAVLLPQEQRAAAERTFVDLRRELWLEPRLARHPLPDYAGEGVDVARLLGAARGEGGELQPLAPARLRDVMDEYALRMDALLQQDATSERAAAIERRIARAQGDAALLLRLEREAVERWRRQYQLSEQTVAAVERVAAADLGATAAQRWRDRWRREAFPWLHRDERPDRLLAWMAHESLSAEARQHVEEIRSDYEARRAEVDGAVIEAVLQGRLSLGRLVHPASTAAELEGPGGSELHARLLRLSGQRQTLLDGTAARLEALLSPQQRKRAP